MRIEIEIIQPAPPIGRLLDTHGQHHAFEGWLDLMRVLADSIESGDAPAANG